MISHSSVLKKLQDKLPNVEFEQGEYCVWSPLNNKIIYTKPKPGIAEQEAVFALIHEVAHATLGHFNYHTDTQLLKLESEAWAKAIDLAQEMNIDIPEDHIQHCLDTYRDWGHKRSKCPTCGVISVQKANQTYHCFNCQTAWKVPVSPLCQLRRIVVSS
jgi:hypothetical protein